MAVKGTVVEMLTENKVRVDFKDVVDPIDNRIVYVGPKLSFWAISLYLTEPIEYYEGIIRCVEKIPTGRLTVCVQGNFSYEGVVHIHNEKVADVGDLSAVGFFRYEGIVHIYNERVVNVGDLVFFCLGS